jgi:hypothetical protein
MKKKKLSKIVRLTLQELRNSDQASIPKSLSEPMYEYSEYDSAVSDKFKKMLDRILNYRENLNITINEERITVTCEDAKKLKSNSVSYNDDGYLEIMIRKDQGFYVNYGYKSRINFEDKNIYSEMLPIISKKLKKINVENFEKLWSNLMVESGISRDINLDTILGD